MDTQKEKKEKTGKKKTVKEEYDFDFTKLTNSANDENNMFGSYRNFDFGDIPGFRD